LENRDGQIVAKKGNELVKDKVGNPLPVNDLFNSFASEQGWLKTPGRGAGNEPGGNSSQFKSKEEAYKYMDEKGIDPMSKDGEEILTKLEQD